MIPEHARAQMIDQQLRPLGILDDRVLDVMATVRREDFVPAAYRGTAFADADIPIGHGALMLAPKIQGRALQAVGPTSQDTVLEIGTGTGFLTTCLARLSRQVRSLDIEPDFTAVARERLDALAVSNVTLETIDAFDVQLSSRYDVIVITGALPVYDDRFERALAPGGRLFVVVGEPPAREALRIVNDGDGGFREVLFETDIPSLRNAPAPERFLF